MLFGGTSSGTGSAVIACGDRSWYFLTADYAFGQALDADASKVIKEKGDSVLWK
jgi:branched-chain amino acid transport system substrate-binding protein